MTNGMVDREALLAQLTENQRRIASLTSALSLDQLHSAPSPGEWSVNDVLAHIRSCADVWGGCIARMLAEDHPTIRAVNPRSWIKKSGYPGLEFPDSLSAYSAQRIALLALLESLRDESWQRGATVTGAGAVLERTVAFYALWLANHERTHVKQIERIVTAMQSH